MDRCSLNTCIEEPTCIQKNLSDSTIVIPGQCPSNFSVGQCQCKLYDSMSIVAVGQHPSAFLPCWFKFDVSCCGSVGVEIMRLLLWVNSILCLFLRARARPNSATNHLYDCCCGFISHPNSLLVLLGQCARFYGCYCVSTPNQINI